MQLHRNRQLHDNAFYCYYHNPWRHRYGISRQLPFRTVQWIFPVRVLVSGPNVCLLAPAPTKPICWLFPIFVCWPWQMQDLDSWDRYDSLAGQCRDVVAGHSLERLLSRYQFAIFVTLTTCYYDQLSFSVRTSNKTDLSWACFILRIVAFSDICDFQQIDVHKLYLSSHSPEGHSIIMLTTRSPTLTRTS